MLIKDEISNDEICQYLIENKIDDTIDMNIYHIKKCDIVDINENIINITVNFKSKEPTIHEDFKINGQVVSMDYVIVNTYDIPIDKFNIYLRGKKLSKITDGIL